MHVITTHSTNKISVICILFSSSLLIPQKYSMICPPTPTQKVSEAGQAENVIILFSPGKNWFANFITCFLLTLVLIFCNVILWKYDKLLSFDSLGFFEIWKRSLLSILPQIPHFSLLTRIPSTLVGKTFAEQFKFYSFCAWFMT